MSAKVDKFCDDLRGRLNAVEDHMAKIQQRVDTAKKESRAAIKAKTDEVKAKIDAQKKHAEEAKAKIKSRIEEKKTETDAKIEEWKTNREQHKLDKRADRAEDYAAACITIASDYAWEAELATLEAIDARLLAEEFASGSS